MESELHRGVLSSVQQLLEEEAPEWAGPEDAPVVQSSQWGFTCPGRWADEILPEEDIQPRQGDLHQPWFEPQRSCSVGHAPDRFVLDEPKRRSRKRSKRRKPEVGESTIRVLQLEQLLMLDEQPSSQMSPVPVGKQPRRAISQPPLQAKAKAQAAKAPLRPIAEPKSEAEASQPDRKTQKRRPYQSFYQTEIPPRPPSGSSTTAAWQRSERHGERLRRVCSPENLVNPEAVAPEAGVGAPEHVGGESEGHAIGLTGSKHSTVPQRGTFHLQPTRNSEISEARSEKRRRPRSRPKTPKPSTLPQRSGRAWRAGRRPSDSTDPAQGPMGSTAPGPAETEENT